MSNYRRPTAVSAALGLALLALPAAADHEGLPHPADSAPSTVHCSDSDPGSHDFVTDVGGEPAFGAFSAPLAAPTVLVVIGHGSTHTVESWKAHMEGLSEDYGTLNVAMEYRGMQRVAGHHDPDDTLPLAEKWPQKAGGEDLIAAAKRFQAECPSIETTILVGISMGVAMTGYAVSHLPPGDEDVFDYWVAVEGVHQMIETYHEAKAVSHPAATWIEEETGGTPQEVPQEYQERTNTLQTAAIEATGLQRVVYLHAVYDGVVGYPQSRTMASELQIPFEFYTVTTPGDGPPGSTLSDLFVDPGDNPSAGLFAGHASEWRADALLMRATFERVGALALGTPTFCGEYHVDPGPVFPDVVFTPVATHSCTLVGNAPPEAGDDAAATVAGFEITIDVQANDSDPDDDPLVTVAATPGEQGSTAVEPDGRVTYTPDAGFSGGDSFDYVISDAAGGADTGTVLVPEPGRAGMLLAGALLLAWLQKPASSATPRTKSGSIA